MTVRFAPGGPGREIVLSTQGWCVATKPAASRQNAVAIFGQVTPHGQERPSPPPMTCPHSGNGSASKTIGP
jgi:hypothetical protein